MLSEETVHRPGVILRVETTSILIGAAALGAAVAIVTVGWNRPPASVGVLGGEIAARVDATAQKVTGRAQAIARLPRLAWVIATDEATMLDLTASELALSAQPGEMVGVAQIAKQSRRVTWLWRAGWRMAQRLPTAAAGVHATFDGDELILFAVTPVVPEARRNELDGAVVVARAVELSAVRDKLVAEGMSARLETPDGEITLGRADAKAQSHPLRLLSAAHEELQVSIAAPPAGPSGLSLALASLVLGVSLGLVALLEWRSARRRQHPRLDDDEDGVDVRTVTLTSPAVGALARRRHLPRR